MELSDVTQQAIGAALRGAAARQEALTANLANANTPGYVRKDVDFHSALQNAMGTGRKPGEVSFTPVQDIGGMSRADGSTLDIDAESAKLAANGLDHQAAVSIAATRTMTMRTALGVV